MSRAEVLAAYFRAHPNQWVCGLDLEFAGRYAWRSRVAEIRRPPFSLNIINRQRRVRRPDGDVYVVSEYAYTPSPADACLRDVQQRERSLA